MKKVFSKIAVLLLLTAISFSGCDKAAETAIDTFIPNFVNNYQDLDHADVTFSFTLIGTNTAEGNFTGSENNFNAGTSFNFTGTFKNSYVELTYSDGPRAPKKYTGNFNTTTTNPYKLTVKNGSDVIRMESL